MERHKEYEQWLMQFGEMLIGHEDLLIGKCLENCHVMQLFFPELRPLWGWVDCERHKTWPHWYLKAPDGRVLDPTRTQFKKINGYGEWPHGEYPVGCCP